MLKKGKIELRRRSVSEINVVPYIDVMLVLLVIFMVTVPIIQQGIDVDLPETDTQVLAITEENQPIVLTINKDGNFFLNIGSQTNRSVVARTVVTRVSSALSINPNAPVLVKSDKTVPYAIVVRGMGLLQAAGAKSVGLITNPNDE